MKMEKGGIKKSFQNLFSRNDFKPKNIYTHGILDKISRCHTKDLGYHCYQCDNPDCLHSHTQYHSCGNRHCPFCGNLKKDEWVESRVDDLLPTPYYHIVFTVPHSWNKVMMQAPKQMYKILFDAASETLLNLGRNPKFLGGTPGITAVLHTWGQSLDYHVHLHCVVSGGGVDKNNDWIEEKRSNGKFLFPRGALRKMYKALFLKLADQRKGEMNCANDQIEDAIRLSGYKKWKVYAKAPFGGPDQVIKYLGRYSHKTAITHYRIKSVQDGKVSFEYKDYADGNKKKVMTLSTGEFLRRFEMHILPKRFVRIRHFGFLTNRGKTERIDAIRENMDLAPAAPKVEVSVSVRLLEKFGKDITKCSKCLEGHYELLFTKRYGKITYSKARASPAA
jgi:Putative transposase/Transposase zinc-binding domain